MAALPFLKSQRNEVFQAIQDHNLNPKEFEWIEQEVVRRKNEAKQSIVLVHQPTRYFYAFYESDDGTHWPVYSPGLESVIYTHNSGSSKWEHRISNVRTWLDYLKREIESPDLWAALNEDSHLVDAASDPNLEDTPFSQAELDYISSALKEIREYVVETHDLPPATITFIESRLKYLENASKRQGRQAWIHTTIGVLFTIVVGAAFAPDSARELFRFSANVLSRILGGQLLLP